MRDHRSDEVRRHVDGVRTGVTAVTAPGGRTTHRRGLHFTGSQRLAEA